MKKSYVYILMCSNGRYYVGSTKDIKDRYNRHESGRVNATRHVRPLILEYVYECEADQARKIEAKLKRYKSTKMIDRFIENGPFWLE